MDNNKENLRISLDEVRLRMDTLSDCLNSEINNNDFILNEKNNRTMIILTILFGLGSYKNISEILPDIPYVRLLGFFIYIFVIIIVLLIIQIKYDQKKKPIRKRWKKFSKELSECSKLEKRRNNQRSKIKGN